MALFSPRRIGLALGSGAARGFAHIGVLKVLEAEGLAPDVIAGTSMGAIVGALYAAGTPVAEIEQIALDFDVRAMMGIGEMAFGRGGVIAGGKVETFLREIMPATFAQLRLPFGCVATDLTRNVAVRFTEGDLIGAVRASMSVPLMLLPVRMDDMLLVDGFVTEPVPVSLARHLGGQTIVAVDVSGSGTVSLEGAEGRTDVFSPLALRSAIVGDGSYQRGSTGLDITAAVSESFERRVAEPALRSASVVISPDVHHLSGFEFPLAAQAIAAGEEAAADAVERIRRVAHR